MRAHYARHTAFERGFHALSGIDPTEEQGWRRYAVHMPLFSVILMTFAYTVLWLQNVLPGNPPALAGVGEHLAFNTAIRFTGNTNWQSYGGESTMSNLAQMLEPALRALAAQVDAGQGEAIDASALMAPLPRAWQWLDGSAFATHGVLMQQAFGLAPIETDRPLMYQGMSHRFLSATEDVPLPSEADGIDFEGEFGVVIGDVPMGCSADDALAYVRLVVLINDWSLRAIAPVEMKTGFGWVQAKPACSVAPFAVTPDALGEAWRDGRVCLPLTVAVNGAWFGSPVGDAMAFGFHELIAHAARTRGLPAGTIIGSGTVSNPDHVQVGSTCISERRAIETIADGAPATRFLGFGDRVAMRAGNGLSPFGRTDQIVTRAP